jgi:hypothetical protein
MKLSEDITTKFDYLETSPSKNKIHNEGVRGEKLQ